MLTEGGNASAILAFIFMLENVSDRKKGLANLMAELEPRAVSLQQLIQAVKVPLVYKLAVNLGDEDVRIANQVRTLSLSFST